MPKRDSISARLREIAALIEAPSATRDISNQLLEKNILSRKGIATHTERVLRFLFAQEM